MELKKAFGQALKQLRVAKGLTQEDFSSISSRTYLSTLERGLKCPTLEKLEGLASVMEIHPLSVLAIAYQIKGEDGSIDSLLARIRAEVGSSASGYDS
ncbi:helix-turn-helix domain-containing protein [Pseudomonas avellanae]|uniref:helix-turn-helix domain-containing protein n=1 Tax=Pseudomonas avellanae TaxID=46257 RepID=UPI000462AC1D|nr:helix-turn-helix transcriptional regulator [Pseudomonas avellanae]UQW74112.1 helix-turn-helix domain-containing protein [Pseudomonas avellanae]UQW75972.1 helix-turn-helix domain-containing protein [Pseudomonas avellanae]UQW76452.1 helix-turn-helix domain-containing protein [Pseudomonas avellanae]